MSQTFKNLREAFTGESQANRRYIAFSKRAEDEGYPQVAKLFRAASEAETVHALNHLRIMKEVKSTLENLNTALEGESFEYSKMYPGFIEQAKKENKSDVVWSFDVANKVEQIHAGLFTKAIKSLKIEKKMESIDYYVCQVCGNTVEDKAPDKCPICGAPSQKFKKIV